MTLTQTRPDETAPSVLRQAALFRGLDADKVEALCRQVEPTKLDPTGVLFREGEPGDDLYIVLSGKVKLGQSTPDGREALVAVMGPGDQFGELSLFDPGPRTARRNRGDCR
jgi:CRP-like cAMP-binding protein